MAIASTGIIFPHEVGEFRGMRIIPLVVCTCLSCVSKETIEVP
jgi:hypothetical protein